MKTKRRIVIAVVVLLSIAYGISILPNFFRRPAPPSTMAALQGLSRDRFVKAVHAYIQDGKMRNGAPSNAVELRDLVSGGYLRSNDIRGLEGQDVIVYLGVEKATPSTVWIAARQSDGSQIGISGDGKIGVLPKP